MQLRINANLRERVIRNTVSFLRKCRREWFVLLCAVIMPMAFVWALSLHYKLGLNLDKSLECRLYLVKKGVIPLKGEFIAFRCKDLRPYFPEGFLFVKRVIGEPGDGIATGSDGKDFYINGRFAARARETDSLGRPALPMRVNEPHLCPDCWFVLGDHPQSYDSRYWGYVHKEQIIGKAFCLF